MACVADSPFVKRVAKKRPWICTILECTIQKMPSWKLSLNAWSKVSKCGSPQIKHEPGGPVGAGVVVVVLGIMSMMTTITTTTNNNKARMGKQGKPGFGFM
mmetsp:Transcript_88642/g.173364  ORF Transcript_88642/g.173364 Transcript_88642/m.173364 type:complete len:101 (-) Transcript_88642:95-397(-)